MLPVPLLESLARRAEVRLTLELQPQAFAATGLGQPASSGEQTRAVHLLSQPRVAASSR